MTTKLYAFWHYDSFPYVLGGTVTEIKDRDTDYPGKGYVETEEYGAGSWFKPVAFYPEKQGKEIMKQLEELAKERRIVLEATNKTFISKAKAIQDLIEFR